MLTSENTHHITNTSLVLHQSNLMHSVDTFECCYLKFVHIAPLIVSYYHFDFNAALVPYTVLLSILTLSQQNNIFLLHCLRMLCIHQTVTKSTRVQVIHSRIILLCYLWTKRRSPHLMCHWNNREACGESSALPEKQR